MGRLRELLTLPHQKFAELLVDMQDSKAAHGLIARAANRHISKPEKEAGSILSNAQRHTHFLDSPRMIEVTKTSHFAFADLRKQTASLFVVLPPDRLDVYARWLRLIVAQGLQDIVRDAQRPSEAVTDALSAPGTPTLFLLDEFASLGRLAPVERAMGLMAGYGVQLWPILQDDTKSSPMKKDKQRLKTSMPAICSHPMRSCASTLLCKSSRLKGSTLSSLSALSTTRTKDSQGCFEAYQQVTPALP